MLEVPPVDPLDEGFLPRIGIGTRNYSAKAIGQAGLPPGKDLSIETQAPAQYAGATREETTVPLVSPREEHEEPLPAERAMPSYQTPNEASLGDWAKQVQASGGVPKLQANSNTRTYTNKDLDEVVSQNRGSTMRVSESSTTNDDELDLGRREARRSAEFAAGQSKLDSIIQDPTGEAAKERDYQRRLGIASAAGDARLRQDRTSIRMEDLDADYEAAEAEIDAAVAAGTVTPQQAAQHKQSLEIQYARQLRAIRAAARQRQLRKNPEDALLAPPPDED